MLILTRLSKPVSRLPLSLHSQSVRTLATHAGPALETTAARLGAAVQLLEDIPDYLEPDVRRRLPAFTISRARGFLPRDEPVVHLPEAFAVLESLLDRMTLVQPDGSNGLLAQGEFGHAVIAELGGESVRINRAVEEAIGSGDQNIISALFRDFSFLTSAYLLEPVDLHFKQTGKYCAGRDLLPSSIAIPFKKLADALGHFPYMEYASSYALQNFAKVDPKKPVEYSNLKLIRAFGDRSKSSSESGFILVHVDMVAHSGHLVSAVEAALAAVSASDRVGFNQALDDLYQTYQKINLSMHTMWGHSKPADYLKFRSFIFGTGPGKRLNQMFPNGVWYEGVSDEPLYFRGESGANDSMIPVGDNLLEITSQLPQNEFTAILRDFRSYRPKTQRDYVSSVEQRATAYRVKQFAEADVTSLSLYALNVDQIREFRDRHWKFTKSYILEHSTYGIATGGSPIATYLPANLSTVLDVLESACKQLPQALPAALPAPYAAALEICRAQIGGQKVSLAREVAGIVARQEAKEIRRDDSISSLLTVDG